MHGSSLGSSAKTVGTVGLAFLGTTYALLIGGLAWRVLVDASDGFYAETLGIRVYFITGSISAAYIFFRLATAHFIRVLGDPDPRTMLGRLAVASFTTLPWLFAALLFAAPVALLWPAALYLFWRHSVAKRRKALAADTRQVLEIEGAIHADRGARTLTRAAEQ